MSDKAFKSIQCTAKSKASGQQCRRRAIKGATVCQMHGGTAPQVKAKAEETLKEWRMRRALQIDKGVDLYLATTDGKRLAALIQKSPALIAKMLDVSDQFRGGGKRTEITGAEGRPIAFFTEASPDTWPKADDED